jgi:hypothetical protein
VAKGPLGQVWISAHANRKLTKQQIQSTNIDLTSKSILEPATPFALRLSGQLLLGLVVSLECFMLFILTFLLPHFFFSHLFVIIFILLVGISSGSYLFSQSKISL